MGDDEKKLLLKACAWINDVLVTESYSPLSLQKGDDLGEIATWWRQNQSDESRRRDIAWERHKQDQEERQKQIAEHQAAIARLSK